MKKIEMKKIGILAFVLFLLSATTAFAETESNDTYTTANVFTYKYPYTPMYGTQSGTMSNGDVDWFKFDGINQVRNLYLSYDGSTPIRMELYELDGSSLTLVLSTTANSIYVPATTKQYYLKLAFDGTSQNSTGYTLTLNP